MVYKPTNNWGAPSYPIFNGGKNSDHVIYRTHYTTGDPPSAAHMLRLPQVRRRVPSLMDTASNTLLQQKKRWKVHLVGGFNANLRYPAFVCH